MSCRFPMAEGYARESAGYVKGWKKKRQKAVMLSAGPVALSAAPVAPGRADACKLDLRGRGSDILPSL